MPDPIEVLVPLLNPNEPEVQVARVYVVEGQKVQEGDPLCTLESTKSVTEVTAVREGFIVGLEFVESDLLRAGDRLCWLADDSKWTPPEEETSPADVDEGVIPDGLRITKPALRLARDHGLDPTSLPKETLITESVVRRFLELEGGREMELSEADFDDGEIVVYGGGGHGKSVIDMIRALGQYQVIGNWGHNQPNPGIQKVAGSRVRLSDPHPPHRLCRTYGAAWPGCAGLPACLYWKRHRGRVWHDYQYCSHRFA
jgi:hypothetical protein